MGGWSGSTGLVLRWFPVTPDRVELQDDESDQRSPPPPFVPHLLEETEHPVGPLHVVVGPNPLTDRVVQIRHQLGELSVAVNEGTSFAPLAVHGRRDWIAAERGPERRSPVAVRPSADSREQSERARREIARGFSRARLDFAWQGL